MARSRRCEMELSIEPRADGTLCLLEPFSRFGDNVKSKIGIWIFCRFVTFAILVCVKFQNDLPSPAGDIYNENNENNTISIYFLCKFIDVNLDF